MRFNIPQDKANKYSTNKTKNYFKHITRCHSNIRDLQSLEESVEVLTCECWLPWFISWLQGHSFHIDRQYNILFHILEDKIAADDGDVAHNLVH